MFETPREEETFTPEAENEIKQFERNVERVNLQLIDELRENYGELEYHNPEHSIGVGDKAVGFLSEGTPDRLRILARTIGYGHDIIQTYNWRNETPQGAPIIGQKRFRDGGIIEQQSAEYVIKLLVEEGIELTVEELSILDEAIMATVPGYSIELRTVTQPNLKDDSHEVAWAIGAADLGSAGSNPEQFLKDGDNVFREDRMLPNLDTLDDTTLSTLYQEAIGWTASQVGYAEGQKQYWNREGVPEQIKTRLTSFDESIELCQKRLERRQALFDNSKSIKENLQTLLDDMKFTRFEK